MQTELLSCKERRGLGHMRITRMQIKIIKRVDGKKEHTTLCSTNVRIIPALHASAALGGAVGHAISLKNIQERDFQ